MKDNCKNKIYYAFLLHLIFMYQIYSQKLWTKIFGTGGTDNAFNLATYKNYIYVVGKTYGNLDGNINLGGYDAFLTKYDSSGQKLWTKLIGSSGDEEGHDLVIDSLGNIYVTGLTNGNLDNNINILSNATFLRHT